MIRKIIALLFLLIFSSISFAGSIHHVIFLGDSLSDNGNLYKLFLKLIPKSPPYYQGRFSNGPTWAEWVVQNYHDQYGMDYKIYAMGGATAIPHAPTSQFIAPTTLELELDQYLIDSLFQDKSEAMIVFWIGANDYLYDVNSNMDQMTTKVVDKISWAMTALIQQGVKKIIVLNLPDLSRIPFAKMNNIVERLRAETLLHNQKLADVLKKIEATYPDTKINFVDIYGLMTEMMDNPDKYNKKYNVNITNITEACWSGSYTMTNEAFNQTFEAFNQTLRKELQQIRIREQDTADFILQSPSLLEAYKTAKLAELGVEPCKNPDEYLFWDNMHPTRIVHQVLSKIIMEKLIHIAHAV